MPYSDGLNKLEVCDIYHFRHLLFISECRRCPVYKHTDIQNVLKSELAEDAVQA